MRNLFLLVFIIALSSCKTSKETMMETSIDERLLDTLTVSAPRKADPDNYTLPVFNPSATKYVDLIHTRLDLSFDWSKQHVLGEAVLTLRPYFYDLDQIQLDAVGFDIHELTLQGKKVKYDYDGAKLTIDLGHMYSRDNLFDLEIKYTAKPEETPAGSSEAITSEKGLFFINPLKSDPNKPQQIWTQGETENNSRWFPTIDKPNERCSQEISLTVEDRFSTLSNGKLVSSTKNADGTRTDYWKQDKPHAPYLFMIGIGEYAVVKDKWKDIDLLYYVEPAYEKDAKLIFNHTAEMLDFFSEKLQYPYPWDKYAQIICKDFVSGAMENTGAVTFGDFVQRHKKQLVDADNDYIVAHELFHHWFGDLVTCESWANLTMNEGFANYSEYLWFEHKYGKDRADHHRQNEMDGYLGSLRGGGAHALIHYGYDDKEQMFDAHSYNKGGLVLHMLRALVGDDAFFTSLNKYLVDNEFTEVEADELRLAFEDVTGQDLIWFFDQWYFEAGHPQLNVEYLHLSDTLEVNVKQVQDPLSNPPIFILPTTLAIYNQAGKASYHDITLDQREQTFKIPYKEGFSWASLDAFDVLLAEISSNKTQAQYAQQFLHSKNYREQMFALSSLEGMENADDIYVEALSHPYHNIRRKAINAISTNEIYRSKMEKLAIADPHSNVRASAIYYLSKLQANPARTGKIVEEMKSIITKDESYRPANAALKYIHSISPKDGLSLADELFKHPDNAFAGTITDIYIASGDDNYVPVLLGQLEKSEEVDFYFASQKMLPFFKEQKEEVKLKAAKIYLEKTKSEGPPFVGFVAKAALKDLESSLGNDVSDETKAEFDKILKDIPEE